MSHHVYHLTDPDLPQELHPIRDIFLPPEPQPPPGRGYQKFLATREKLRRKVAEKQMAEQQTSLLPEESTSVRRVNQWQ